MNLYHITERSQWIKYDPETFYIPANYLADGFIHCSTIDQVLTVAEKYYADVPNLLLLKIDEKMVSAAIVFENLEGGEEKFPHIYGHLEKKAIVGIVAFEKDSLGNFYLPEFT